MLLAGRTDVCCWIALTACRMAYGLGLAGDSGICILPRGSSDPRTNHFDNVCLQPSSMAYGFVVLGFHGIHNNHEYCRRKVPTQVRGINSHNPHSWFFCHSASISIVRSPPERIRGIHDLFKHWELAYSRSFVPDRTDWVSLHVHG